MAASAETSRDLTGWEVARVRGLQEPRAYTLTAPSPRWFGSVIDRVQHLLSLPSGWDSYGSRPIAVASAELALDVMSDPLFAVLGAPTVVPTSTGGVQAEWYADGRSLEIEFLSDQRLSVLLSDEATGDEEAVELDYDLSRLREFARRLRG